MAVIENLGKLPRKLFPEERKDLETCIKNGFIMPKGRGTFTAEGIFTLVYWNPDDRHSLMSQMWGAVILKFDHSKDRLYTDPRGWIQIYRDEGTTDGPTLVGTMTAGNIRKYYAYDSGLTTVSEGGYVLPPTATGDHLVIGSGKVDYLSGQDLLEEINRGMESKYAGSGRSFERVLDLSFVRKPVIYLHLQSPSPFCNQDAVVLDMDTRLPLPRERVYPFISQEKLDQYYRY